MPSKLSDYDILGEIGSGSYGTCKKIRRRSDKKVQFQTGAGSCSNIFCLACMVSFLKTIIQK